ncbi:MAG: type II toxin-antitoxin system VapC family toxin [Opitutaceae bacterium]|jgi:predicted nucleic acid-binding protein|nr:type II toxin-antitoxin system VapC family toxin [Opitutaceae bacterium]
MLLLDTSFIIELENEVMARANGPAKRFLASHSGQAVAISIISLGEFAEGFDNKLDVESFITRFRVIQLSRAIAYKAAAMQRVLKQRLGENDAWIAATALVYDADLAGNEKAFSRVPRLKYKVL